MILDGKAAAMNKVDEWRKHAYAVAVKLCKDYGKEGKSAFKVGSFRISRIQIPPISCPSVHDPSVITSWISGLPA